MGSSDRAASRTLDPTTDRFDRSDRLRRVRVPLSPYPTQRPGPGQPPSPAVSTAARPTVGVAFGGGSAKGISHVGVIKWLEEHRIPVDAAVGTSMGGLVGGAYASGMDAQELEAFISAVNWDELFNGSTFTYKNIRRTSGRTRDGWDRRARRLLDELPTPFRAVAVDLLSARQAVLERGWLADAMRATMSLPLIFPPMERRDHEQHPGRRGENARRQPRHRRECRGCLGS